MEIYLDNSATTKPYNEVVEEMVKALTTEYGNPSSLHKKGIEVDRKIKEIRQNIARTLGTKDKEIFFTSGGTESNNTIIRGVAYNFRKIKNHIISTVIEHPSVLNTLADLEKEGFEITLLEVDASGKINIEDLKKAIRPSTILISTLHVNNEVGSIQPIEEIGKYLKTLDEKIYFHVDCVQSYTKIKFRPSRYNIDFMTVSGHKFHGPKGIGVLYAKKGVRLTSLIAGGAQERGKRAGTENIPAILGMAAALQDACDHMEENTHHCLELRERLIAGLSKIPHSVLNGDREHRLPSNVHFCFEGIEGESLLLLLDQKGICASSGSACTSGSLDPSHVLLAIGRPHEIAHGSLRLSLGEENTMAEVDYMLQAIPEVVAYLRHMSPVWRDLESGKKSFLL